jgi:hypothetical protein
LFGFAEQTASHDRLRSKLMPTATTVTTTSSTVSKLAA